MVITANKEMLTKAIGTADAIVSAKNSNTLLSNCMLNVSTSAVEVLATDNEIAIRTRIDAVSDKAGQFAVSGKKLMQIVRELPNSDVTLGITSNYQISVKSKAKELKGQYTLIGQSADEYPEIPAFDETNCITIGQSELKTMLKKVVHAASSEVIKPVFNGLFIKADGNKLVVVATDSRRLSVVAKNVDGITGLDDGIIIPLKTVNQVLRVLDNSGECAFSYNDNQVFFRIGNTEIISRIVDSCFPDYKGVLPKSNTVEAVIETKKLNESLRRAMIFTREPANKIVMRFAKDKLIIDVNTPDLGESKEEIVVESANDTEISIGINGQFFIDALKEIDSAHIKCGISGDMKPFTVQSADSSDHISVIMPIQIKGADL